MPKGEAGSKGEKKKRVTQKYGGTPWRHKKNIE